MLDHPENKNISIQKYDQELLSTSILVLWLFIIRLLTLVHLKVIANIQYYPCVSTTFLYYRKNYNKISPTTML